MASIDSAKSDLGVVEPGAGDLVAGRYRLATKIGMGGMGSVWLSEDQALDTICAVKLIDVEKASNEEVRMRFAREAKALAQLRCAHVVDVFDYGEWDRTLYIAMEYLSGEDLATRLERQGRLNQVVAYRIIAHVARALMSAHALGIVHRDLKPDNVYLVQSYDEEIAKVLDFGIARYGDDSTENRTTRTRAFLGTPCYVSPEQARGRDIDHRSDLWSLGVIAFQCLTGRLPFESHALGELMGLILYEPIPKPCAFNPELPAGIDAWWDRAAARDREQRFQSAKEMADELGSVLGIQTMVNVPTVPPRCASSFPPATEASGVITAPKALALPELGHFPQPHAAQRSFVQVVASAPGAVDEVVEPTPPSGAPHAHRTANQRFASKGWILAGLTVAMLAAFGLTLGLWLREKSVDAVRIPSESRSADVREEAPIAAQAQPPKAEVADALSVDRLPLLPPGDSLGERKPGSGRAKSERASPNIRRRAGSAADRSTPPAPVRTGARDYGI